MRNHPLNHYVFYQAIIQTVRRIPIPMTYFLARNLALFFYLFSSRDRRNLTANLSVVFNGDSAQARRTCLNLFRSYGRYLVDYFLLPQLPITQVKNFFSPQIGEENLIEGLNQGKGVLLLTGHLGNWEMGGILLSSLNYPINIVTLPHGRGKTNNLIRGLRKEKRIATIEVGSSPLSAINILQALKRNEIVALLADKVYLGKSAPVSFFGRKIAFPLGPYLLAQASGAAVLPVFMVREDNRRYRGFIEAPIPPGQAGGEDAIRMALDRYVRLLEKFIRRYPEQWYNPDSIFTQSKS